MTGAGARRQSVVTMLAGVSIGWLIFGATLCALRVSAWVVSRRQHR